MTDEHQDPGPLESLFTRGCPVQVEALSGRLSPLPKSRAEPRDLTSLGQGFSAIRGTLTVGNIPLRSRMLQSLLFLLARSAAATRSPRISRATTKPTGPISQVHRTKMAGIAGPHQRLLYQPPPREEFKCSCPRLPGDEHFRCREIFFFVLDPFRFLRLVTHFVGLEPYIRSWRFASTHNPIALQYPMSPKPSRSPCPAEWIPQRSRDGWPGDRTLESWYMDASAGPPAGLEALFAQVRSSRSIGHLAVLSSTLFVM